MRFSHSMLSIFRACPLKFKFKYVDQLVPIQPHSMHDLSFGSAWDAGLTVWYRDGDAGKALDAFATSYPQSRYPAVLPVNSQGKTFENGLKALAGYINHWAEEDEHWTVLHVQKKQISNDGERTLKLDMIVRDDRDGQVYGVDTKSTSSYLDGKFWSRFQPNSQVRMYTDHIKSRFGYCGGFIINAASFKHRSKAYTPRTGPDKSVQLPAGDWFSFARMTFNPNEDCLQLERENFAYWVGRIETDKATSNFGYNDQSCHQYGRECEYLKLCENGYTWPRDEDLILSSYRQCCPKVLDEGRCQLGLGHEGECDPTVAAQMDNEIELDGEMEDAVI